MSLDASDSFSAALSELNEQSLGLRTQMVEIGTRYEFFGHVILRNCLDPQQTEKNEITRSVQHFLARLNPSRGSGGEPFHPPVVYPLQLRFANRSLDRNQGYSSSESSVFSEYLGSPTPPCNSTVAEHRTGKQKATTYSIAGEFSRVDGHGETLDASKPPSAP